MRDEAFLGIDLGTSSVKVVVVDCEGRQCAGSQVPYPVSRPRAGWAEQDPERWWTATTVALTRAVSDAGRPIAAIGVSGQMHGLVLVDGAGRAIRPAVIWSDARAHAQVAEWERRVDVRSVELRSGFPVASGMAGVSLTWVRDNEPDNYRSARTLLMPKDYLRFRLTGRLATEPSDAGGSLLYDISDRVPQWDVLDRVGLRADLLPPVIPSLAEAGSVTAAASDATGLAVGTPVIAGGGDQSMAAVALGLEATELAAVAISSGATAFRRVPRPRDVPASIHVVPHVVPGQWLAMGAILSAGLSVDWIARRLFGGSGSPTQVTSLMRAAAQVPPGADGLLFSSQLGGLRTPVVDPTARGGLVGLGFDHGREHITRALVEGVCLTLAGVIRLLDRDDDRIEALVISGGAARFPLWRQTLSDATALPVHVSRDVEHSALGAALSARSLRSLPPPAGAATFTSTVHPDPGTVKVYRDMADRLDAVDSLLRTQTLGAGDGASGPRGLTTATLTTRRGDGR